MGQKEQKPTSIGTWIAAVALLAVMGPAIFLQIEQGLQGSSSSGSSSADQGSSSWQPKLDKAQLAVQARFQGKEERVAKDALWTSEKIFKVGVYDDGSPRDAYAEYVCQVLYEHGLKGRKVWVQIIDIVQLNRDNDWVKLGQSRCQ